MIAKLTIDEGFVRDYLQLPHEVKVIEAGYDQQLGRLVLVVDHPSIPAGIAGGIPVAILTATQTMATLRTKLSVDGVEIASRLEVKG